MQKKILKRIGFYRWLACLGLVVLFSQKIGAQNDAPASVPLDTAINKSHKSTFVFLTMGYGAGTHLTGVGFTWFRYCPPPFFLLWVYRPNKDLEQCAIGLPVRYIRYIRCGRSRRNPTTGFFYGRQNFSLQTLALSLCAERGLSDWAVHRTRQFCEKNLNPHFDLRKQS